MFFTNGLNLTQRTSIQFSADETSWTLRVHEYSPSHDWDKTWEKSFNSSQDLEVAIGNLPPEGEIRRYIEVIRRIPRPRPRGYAHKEF